MSEDYSATLKDVARRLVLTGQHVQRVGNLIKNIVVATPEPKTTPPRADIPDTDSTQLATFEGWHVASWIGAILVWARKNGWRGHVTSGYRSDAEQKLACIHVCGNSNGCPGTCAKPGTSNHRYKTFPGGAVDVDDPAEFGTIVARYPGAHTIKNNLPRDRGHFSYTGT